VKCLFGLLALSAACAQQSNISTQTYDINGRPVSGVSSIRSGNSSSKVTRDSNGRAVPIESVEDRVISDTGGVKIVERIVKRYDPNGNPGPPERVRIEEHKESDGTVRTLTTVSRGDVNGAFRVAERATTVTRSTGDRTESTTSIERPTLNGSMDLVEKTDQTIVASGAKTTENVSTLRRDTNGRLSEFAKKTREAVTSNGQTSENTAEYETASTGQMRLMRQSTAQVEPTGTRQVTVYLPDAEGKMTLSQQQVIQKTETPNGTVESTTVRFAQPSDPGKLGPARKVEETVCTGDCGRPKP
jgi:hypothetical protein